MLQLQHKAHRSKVSADAILFVEHVLASRHKRSYFEFEPERCPLLHQVRDEDRHVVDDEIASAVSVMSEMDDLGPNGVQVMELIAADWVEGVLASLIGLERVALFLRCTALRWSEMAWSAS